jgi:hypothetical protein
MIASACFLFISLAAVKAIYNEQFKDSLIQRVGLATVSLFSLGMAYNAHLYGATPVLEMYAIGQAVFTFGSMVKR